MVNIKIDYEKSGIDKKQIMEYKEKVENIHKDLHRRADDIDDFVGWLKLPENYDKEEFDRIKKSAIKIQKSSDILLVIGIGGSYLGARAVIEAMSSNFSSLQSEKQRKAPQILYVGNNLSPNYINDLIEVLSDKDFSINVISKSGTTTEPAIAFRIFREILENKYGIDEARSRIYVTTDKKRGALKTLSDNEGYEKFVIPDNVGGRFSVLTAVGLLPIAVAGIDIDKLMQGARLAQDKYNDPNIKYNDCYQYAVLRNVLYNENKTMEIFANYEPKMHYFTEWLKQLFGESEGKESKGIFPVGVDLTTDLHSMGQYIQEGINYLTGKDLDYVNKKAMEGTIQAHVTGGVPNIEISIEKLDEENIGALIYFFELACGMSGSVLGVNPFNQPGVEEYKKNMFKLLEKPGY